MKLTYILALLAALTAPALAGDSRPSRPSRPSDRPRSDWETVSHESADWEDSTRPQSVPEASPTLVLTLAAAAVVAVRRRK